MFIYRAKSFFWEKKVKYIKWLLPAALYVQQLTKAEEHGDNTMATSMQIKSSKQTATAATVAAAAAYKPQSTFKTRLVSKMIS